MSSPADVGAAGLRAAADTLAPEEPDPTVELSPEEAMANFRRIQESGPPGVLEQATISQNRETGRDEPVIPLSEATPTPLRGVAAGPLQGLSAETVVRAGGFLSAHEPANRVLNMDRLAQRVGIGTVTLDSATNTPILHRKDGKRIMLDMPMGEATTSSDPESGFLGRATRGVSETTLDLVDIGAESAGETAGAVAGFFAGGPVGAAVGAGGGSLVQDFAQALSGLDEESAMNIRVRALLAGLGERAGMYLHKVWTQKVKRAGRTVTPVMQEAQTSEAYFKRRGAAIELSGMEMSEVPILRRFFRQLALVSTKGQRFVRERLETFSDLLRSETDPAAAEDLHRHLAAMVNREWQNMTDDLVAAAMFANQGRRPQARTGGLASLEEFGQQVSKLLDTHAQNSQAILSSMYGNSDDLLARSKHALWYSPERMTNTFGAAVGELADRYPRVDPSLMNGQNGLLDKFFGSVRDESFWNVTEKTIKNLGGGDDIIIEMTPTMKLQELSEQLFRIGADETENQSTRSMAKAVRREVTKLLDDPEFIPLTKDANRALAEQGIAAYKEARTAARNRFNQLESLEGLGITSGNPRPLDIVDVIANGGKTDSVIALARVSGGLDALHDMFWTRMSESPEKMAEVLTGGDDRVLKMLFTPPDMPDEVATQVIGNIRTSLDRVRILKENDAFGKLSRETRGGELYRKFVKEGTGASLDLLKKTMREVGYESPFGQSVQHSVMVDFLQGVVDESSPGQLVNIKKVGERISKMQADGTWDLLGPELRELMHNSAVLSRVLRIIMPGGGEGLEVASLAGGLRNNFLKTVAEVSVAEATAMLLTRGGTIRRMLVGASLSDDPKVFMPLLAGALGAAGSKAMGESFVRTDAASPTGVQ